MNEWKKIAAFCVQWTGALLIALGVIKLAEIILQQFNLFQ